MFYIKKNNKEIIDFKRKTIDLIKKWKPELVLIEDKASGQSLLQDLRKEIKTQLIGIKVSKDKVTRLASVSPFFEGGRVFLPTESNWLADYEIELFGFPFYEHDEQIYCTRQILECCKNKNNIKL